MLITEIYKGQGLGNQLWCYVVTRCIALRNNYQFGIKSPENFKCSEFMDIDVGGPVYGGKGPEGGPPLELPQGITYYYRERSIRHPYSLADISAFDKDLISVQDNTKIDGNMQDEKYIFEYKDQIRNWLKVNEKFECYDYAKDDICVINFRGGEYRYIKDVFLPKKYWDDAIAYMLGINKNFKFVIITDDVKTAKKFFPKYSVNHFSIGKDYSIIKNAHYLIIANTSFAWFPAWLNLRVKLCIAPKYWWAHNISDGYWACDSNITEGWLYLDRSGVIYTHDQCAQELINYKTINLGIYLPKKIDKNFLVVSSYGNDLRWVEKRTFNYFIYERGLSCDLVNGVDKSKLASSPNVGYNLYDYFTFIIDNYSNLPECTIFCKGNIFPRHVSEQYFDKVSNNNFFTPILDRERISAEWPVSAILSDTEYLEINNSWYLGSHPVKYFHSYDEFINFCFVNARVVDYVNFAPGANYVVPKENILRLPKIFYENLRHIISYETLPGEAHIIERGLGIIWNSDYEISERMLKPIDYLDSLQKFDKGEVKWRKYSRYKLGYLLPRIAGILKSKIRNLVPASIKQCIKNIKYPLM
jgi:hypothetical protein